MHPLFSETEHLKDSDLEDKIIQLNKKYWQTTNPEVQSQIVLLIDSYKLDLETRRTNQKLINDAMGDDGKSELDKLIKVR
ncbi:hypothetical protein N9D61_02190 [Planktomarina sp.]|jgi:hypothetical protein|nr:hypothetical protein [Planktomarina sp.]